jgi:YhcH/YjgK/YiaL family protein
MKTSKILKTFHERKQSMIIDQINNSHLYYALHPRIRPAFEYINRNDLSSLNVGKYEIDGENLFAMVQQYNSKPKEQGFWEAHRRYMDLQMLIMGTEVIGYANIDRLTQGVFDAKKDFLPLFGEGDFLTLQTGSFALLLPQDAHMPGIASQSPALVKKMVIKISIL